ncbi:S49 family peptidase [Roseospira visakhapatnamensis]|uniref:Protease-4 n=1 Tax=Roseospira visakhapatnamensis TaxID=390880 RepID=A0A7W6RD89_9PROT|nr:S49 family peptidase [Roseospira visakhapatnamensis]MBB4265798.1 protease-4 [Roseospira visakhapatnamensis]
MFRFLGKLIIGLLALVGGLVVVTAIVVALVLPNLMPQRDPLPGAMVLTVDLDQDLSEGEDDPWLGLGDGALPLRTVLDGLERAARDDRVLGLVARVRTPTMGLAQAQELRDAVHAFRTQGKPTFVHADTLTAGGGNGTLAYYLASAFEDVWLQPSGEVGLTGLALEVPFIAKALRDWGLRFEGEARHEFKGVLAGLQDDSMRPAQAQNMGRLVASWFDQVVADVSAARDIPVGDLTAVIDRAPLLAPVAQEVGLIDRQGYHDEFKDAVQEALGEHDEVSVTAYMAREDSAEPEDARRLALIHGVGAVTFGDDDDRPSFSRGLSAEGLESAIHEAVEDERVAAIVLRLDSPGGDYVASDRARRAVAMARERGTPVIVSMGNVVASGGYFIALEADQIVASPATVTGSIGVAAGKLVLEGFWAEQGVSWAALDEGANAAMWSSNRGFSAAARRALDRRLDQIYADFTTRVGQARELTLAGVDEVARGRVFSGADALEVGLVDRLGGLREALRVAREAAALPADEAVVVAPYPEPRPPIERVLDLLEDRGGLPGLAALAGAQAEHLRLLATLGPVLEPAAALAGRLRASGLMAPPSGAADPVRLHYGGPHGLAGGEGMSRP